MRIAKIAFLYSIVAIPLAIGIIAIGRVCPFAQPLAAGAVSGGLTIYLFHLWEKLS